MRLLFLVLAASAAFAQTESTEYQFALLLRGSGAAALDQEQLQKIQAGHMANIHRMAQLGKLLAAGPMAGDSDLRGIFVFRVASRAEAEALAAEDPAIKAGRLRLEWMTWRTRPGIGVGLNEAFRKDPNVKMTMKVHYLVLLRKGEGWTEGDLLSSSGRYLAAGPARGHAEIAGLLVLNAASAEDAKAVVEAEPLVKAGRLKPDIRPWYVAAEVWQ